MPPGALSCLIRRPLIVSTMLLAAAAGAASVTADGEPRIQAEIGASPSAADLRALYGRPRSAWPPATIDVGVAFVELAPLERKPAPSGQAALAAKLGERLFFDRLLSPSGRIACSNCHDPLRGWGDGLAVSTGEAGRQGSRNATALYSAAYRTSWGWDGAGKALATQVLRPLFDSREMGHAEPRPLLEQLTADETYRRLFHAAYGDGPITTERLGDALAGFLAGLEEPTRFDAFAGGDTGQLTDDELQGLHLFRTKARCANCHFGPLLTDESFHNLRLSSFREPSEDLGRYHVAGEPEAIGHFRTPSLRHVSKTAPYMHNGLFPTLAGVLNLYARGGGEVWARNAQEAAHPLYPAAARLSRHIRPLTLSPAEKAALLAFLQTL